MRSNKITVDLTDENRIAVEKLMEAYDMKYGALINSLINRIYYMPEDLRNEFINCALYNCDFLNEGIKISDPWYQKVYSKKRKEYLNYAELFNRGEKINLQDDEQPMKKYKMIDGFLIVPADWIILNPELEGKCRYADVVECRNSEYGVPHFVVFHDTRDFYNEYIDYVYCLCEKKWPGFEELRIQGENTELIKDPNNEYGYLNAEEWLKAPLMGIFHIYRDDEEYFQKDQPFGAMIKSIKKKKQS